jgi:hypothetical protein
MPRRCLGAGDGFGDVRRPDDHGVGQRCLGLDVPADRRANAAACVGDDATDRRARAGQCRWERGTATDLDHVGRCVRNRDGHVGSGADELTARLWPATSWRSSTWRMTMLRVDSGSSTSSSRSG